MTEQTAFCIKCGSDTGVEAIHYDTLRNFTFIKLNCGHVLKITTRLKILTQLEYDENYGDG